GHGGIAGFVKSVAFEWPDVHVRVVDVRLADLDQREPMMELVESLLAECSATGGPTEVGYVAARRITSEPLAAPLQKDPGSTPALNSDSTVLITGGARGITAAIAGELAERYRPNLILIGRSALPDQVEAPETASLVSPAEIKAAMIARMRNEG